jgi:hypothetical protein
MIGVTLLTHRMKWVGLGGLVTVWLALVYVNLIAVPPPQEIPLKYKSGQAAPAMKQTDSAEVWEVHSLQAQARELPSVPKKNIFAATTIGRSLSPHAKVAALQKKQQALAAASIIAPPVPAAPPPPSPEELARQQEALRQQQLREQMAQYRYLGYVNQNGVQKAFLGKGREIYILKEGETLDGKFQVALIEATTVKLLDNESKLETTLKLKKEESSAAGT